MNMDFDDVLNLGDYPRILIFKLRSAKKNRRPLQIFRFSSTYDCVTLKLPWTDDKTEFSYIEIPNAKELDLSQLNPFPKRLELKVFTDEFDFDPENPFNSDSYKEIHEKIIVPGNYKVEIVSLENSGFHSNNAVFFYYLFSLSRDSG
jgi:hypothetical protein